MHNLEQEQAKLNSKQQQAVEVDKGPALVVAGAGTGKTRVIVERINWLLEKDVPAQRILALTFTEKAAAEMLERVNERRASYDVELPIMTFNAYGESQLRRFAADIGMGRNFTLIGDSAQIVFLRERLDKLHLDYFAPVSRPDALLGDIRDYFSKLKQHVITPEDFAHYLATVQTTDSPAKLDKAKYTELSAAYATYIALCQEANVIDYDDQIYLLIELFRKRPNVLKLVQDNYDYILVDEFQDTNPMQSTLVDLLAGTRQNLFVVGDDDQSIYGWRGATLANILDFKQRYPNAKDITLLHNYRSSQPILDSAYRLITHNNPYRLEAQLKINKKLVSNKPGQAPAVYGFSTLDEELQWIGEDIRKRLDNGEAPGSIAVLARRNITIQKLRPCLDYFNIEHVVIGQSYELYQEPAVRIVLEALKTVADPLDNTSLYHTLTGPLFSVSAQVLGQLASQARRQHQNLAEAIEENGEDSSIAAVQRIAEWRELSSATTVGKLAYEIIDSTGYKDRLYSDPLLAVTGTRLSELFNTFKEFEKIALQPTVVEYVDALPALQAAGEGLQDGTLDLSQEKVSLLSVHKSKGLEWPIVYIADCSEGSFPVKENPPGITFPSGLATGHNSEADQHLYEERRLMYVAMTRARDQLILTHADRHSGVTIRKPSRFLAEMFGENEPARPGTATSMEVRLGSFTSMQTEAVEVPGYILKGNEVHLSVSQVVKYLSCPLDFYYNYVLNVPQEPDPATQYGSTMHALLQTINHSLVAGKLVNLNVLEASLLSDWPKYGYLSAAQRQRAIKQGQKTLRSVYARIAKSPRIPVAVEEPFLIKLPDFKLSLSGQIDAVFPFDASVEIVDYKTSTTVDTAEKAKSRANASEQLTLYALAWQHLHGELPAQVTLDFIDTGYTGSLKKTQRGLDGAMLRLQKVADGIRSKDFAPGRDHLFCSHPPV